MDVPKVRVKHLKTFVLSRGKERGLWLQFLLTFELSAKNKENESTRKKGQKITLLNKTHNSRHFFQSMQNLHFIRKYPFAVRNFSSFIQRLTILLKPFMFILIYEQNIIIIYLILMTENV